MEGHREAPLLSEVLHHNAANLRLNNPRSDVAEQYGALHQSLSLSPSLSPLPHHLKRKSSRISHSESQGTDGAPRATICAGCHAKVAGSCRIGSPSAWM